MKYLTQVTEEQRDKIRQAAEELEVTHPTIVQMALDKLFAGDWQRVKAEMKEQKVRKALAEIDGQIKDLEEKKESILGGAHIEIPV